MVENFQVLVTTSCQYGIPPTLRATPRGHSTWVTNRGMVGRLTTSSEFVCLCLLSVAIILPLFLGLDFESLYLLSRMPPQILFSLK